ncbi:hypothetical protein FEDK69T_05080 [Flavobacterium enshiense DK69]|uniref:DUF3307 domain-containing protein n=1 Tax=Flavobacterium enshiense DK69 TaxID=1107311 RepID=V6SEE5_9FLAO|nr:DUF3307 domain-containing protein [Flavobacterium enshiense]ESU24951.1 hypothetical protein FEDK69T_05080 [Flavobacterium enshiense DK69]KGO96610.1 hypothetical protein Q767_02515 [Flavobacterium enshiense DK69]
MFELILKITLAHLLGDFVFQTSSMVNDIENKKFKSKYLYLHGFIHLLLLITVIQFEKQYILPVIILSISHLAIDVITKILIKNKISTIGNLLLDQTLHSITIALFIKHFYNYKIDFNLLFTSQNYLFLIALVCITYVSAILMKKIMELFNYPLPNSGIKDAGKYIGMLERLFIFIFVITNFWEGIGFLLAAKSIFRFGDLKENKEIKLTEYILIGTLLSFGIAIFIGKLYLILKNVI